jgi:tryptophan synthase alpha chain
MQQEETRTRANMLDVVLSDPRPLLTCYLPIGDPLIDDSTADTYRECGVNIVELGLPTPDPYLDGTDVASSMRRAIDRGRDVAQALRSTSRKLRTHEPLMASVCMTYADAELLGHSAAETFDSVDALLVLGATSSAETIMRIGDLRAGGVRRVAFVPAQFHDRDIEAARACDGYVMLQAASGVTGPRARLDPTNAAKVQRLRSAGVKQRIVLGFGIGTADQARAAMEMGADGVVIGSMCLRKALEGTQSLRSFLHDVRASIDG